MNREKSRKTSLLIMVSLLAFMMALSSTLTACSFVEKKAEEAVDSALSVADSAAEKAGEVTAKWLGATAANWEKTYDKAVIERMNYLQITLGDVKTETKDGKRKYIIELTVNNTAPDNEKISYRDLFNDNYLVACDEKDYVYSILPFDPQSNSFTSLNDPLYEDGLDSYYNDTIKPGKNKIKIYTEVGDKDKLSYLLFIKKDKIAIE